MSFFKEIKNQIVATVGLVITAAGGIIIANMEAIFSPSEADPVEVVETVTDTVIVKQPIIMQEQTIIKSKEHKNEEPEKEFNW
jgi:hypothetical protein